jgi:hypothetical protein
MFGGKQFYTGQVLSASSSFFLTRYWVDCMSSSLTWRQSLRLGMMFGLWVGFDLPHAVGKAVRSEWPSQSPGPLPLYVLSLHNCIVDFACCCSYKALFTSATPIAQISLVLMAGGASWARHSLARLIIAFHTLPTNSAEPFQYELRPLSSQWRPRLSDVELSHRYRSFLPPTASLSIYPRPAFS